MIATVIRLQVRPADKLEIQLKEDSMPTLSKGVYWCARDMAGIGVLGNHHLILIVVDSAGNLFGEPTISETIGNTSTVVHFSTYSTTKGDGSFITVQPLVDADVTATREHTDPDQHTSALTPDYDLEPHLVEPESGTVDDLIETVQRLAANFAAHDADLPYTLIDSNCAAWVNTLFKVAGIPDERRKELGEFFGIDWGEEDLLDETYFQPVE